MTSQSFPVHKLCCIESKIDGNADSIFLAATGPCIQSLSGTSGEILSIWPRDEGDSSSDDEDERPRKKVKLDDSGNPSLGREDSEASIEIIAEGKERQKGERRRPKIPDTTLPNVSHLVVTKDGKSVIAITAEDKAVKTFSISRRGRLRQKSSRSMPKKSCALALTPDEQTILTADKFGDVYALPLLPSTDYQRKTETPRADKPFKPSASELTVHTKRNLDTLLQQQKQKEAPVRKEGPDFEHKLLLGHVSLLTDLKTASTDIAGKHRPFILSADRDEHIRVSRGIPQTHIIHTFCAGHTEFVSKLCIVPWNPSILVAGNGEPSLRVYDWQSGEQLSRYDILANLQGQVETILSPDRSIEKLAVSGIWPIRSSSSQASAKRVLLVALEACPIIFVFRLEDSKLLYEWSLQFAGNVLDVVQVERSDQIAISLDKTHELGSCQRYRHERSKNCIMLLPLSVIESSQSAGQDSTPVVLNMGDKGTQFSPQSVAIDSLADNHWQTEIDGRGKIAEKSYSALGELLYGLENLRKRRGKAATEDRDEVEAENEQQEGSLEIPQ